jgi:hypothetical protein
VTGALNSPECFSHEPHYIHDETSDASPSTDPNDIDDYVPEDDVSIIMNTKELSEEQDEMEDTAVASKIMLFSPMEEVLQFGTTTMSTCGLHCRILCRLQFPLTKISCQLPNLLPPYMQTYSQCGTGGLQELIQQNLQQKKTHCLLCLSVL